MITLILDIQNNEAGIGLSIEEQPDLNDIVAYYNTNGGNFWIVLDNENQVIGTIGLMKFDSEWCVLKKFFVKLDYRSQKIGLTLYKTFI